MPTRRGLGGVLPTKKFYETNLEIPENFVQIRPSVQQLFIIFFVTDRWKDGLTNSILNESPLYPIWLQAEFFSAMFFLPLTKRSELALCAHIILFG